MPAAHHACERMNADSHADRLIWIDLEMTGLDTDRDGILEIATVVTDGDLNVLATGPEFAIAHPLSTLDGMDEWNRNQHGNSGLWRRVLEEGVPLAEAEARTLEFLHEWVPAGASAICGNSNCQGRALLPPRLSQCSGRNAHAFRCLAHRGRRPGRGRRQGRRRVPPAMTPEPR